MIHVLTRVLIIAELLVWAGSSSGIAQAEETRSDASARDDLIGWFALPAREHRSHRVIPGHDTLIPVFKRDGTYYSVCRGVEVPLKECSGGLEWAPKPSSMAGTKITFDEAAESYFITIVDQQEAQNNEYSLSGEKQPVKKVEKPAEIPDATAEAPRTNDDFVGWYQLVWSPGIRYEIRKEGGKYRGAMWMARGAGEWIPRDQCELPSLPDRLGFGGLDRKGAVSFTYNQEAKRFEIVTAKSGQSVLRMPLARIQPPPSPEGNAVPPAVRIGIPSWH